MHTDEFIRLMQAGATLGPMPCHEREYMLDTGQRCYRLTQPMIDVLVRQGLIERMA